MHLVHALVFEPQLKHRLVVGRNNARSQIRENLTLIQFISIVNIYLAMVYTAS